MLERKPLNYILPVPPEPFGGLGGTTEVISLKIKELLRYSFLTSRNYGSQAWVFGQLHRLYRIDSIRQLERLR